MAMRISKRARQQAARLSPIIARALDEFAVDSEQMAAHELGELRLALRTVEAEMERLKTQLRLTANSRDHWRERAVRAEANQCGACFDRTPRLTP